MNETKSNKPGLIITRKLGQKVVAFCGKSKIEISVDRITKTIVRLRVEAPDDIGVFREEILNKEKSK